MSAGLNLFPFLATLLVTGVITWSLAGYLTGCFDVSGVTAWFFINSAPVSFSLILITQKR